MELARLDLNLLLVFHHLLREKRVSAVATVLGMSQPAVSSALGRLRASLGDAYQSTYIDDLSVQLDGIDELADKTVATLTFRGVAKTSRFDQGEPFSESWRMERVNGDNQPWLVAGIRQNG